MYVQVPIADTYIHTLKENKPIQVHAYIYAMCENPPTHLCKGGLTVLP